MAEDKIHAYATKSENDAMKEKFGKVVEANPDLQGAKLKFDRDVGAFEVVTEGLKPEQVASLKEKIAEFTGDDAKAAWSADRDSRVARTEGLRSEARSREATTKEPAPAKTREGAVMMYPAPSQKAQFHKDVVETQSNSKYIAKSSKGPHYSVVTSVPDKFAAYIGDEAKRRFEREFAELKIDATKNPDKEALREEAAKRGSAAFMIQYKERGFRLSDPGSRPVDHERQLATMRAATTPQIEAVLAASRSILEPLREKEASMRAEAAGIPVDQLKAMSFADQKKYGVKDGKPVGLVGEDFALNSQLSKGISAMSAELKSRPSEKGVEAEQDRGREPTRSDAREAVQERQAPRSTAKGRSVSEEQSVDDTLATLQASAARRGRGGR